MIELIDLRKGNLVNCQHKAERIKGMRKGQVKTESGLHSSTELSGINITLDIILEYGFRRDPACSLPGWWSVKCPYGYVSICLNPVEPGKWSAQIENLDHEVICSSTISYFHHLQNLVESCGFPDLMNRKEYIKYLSKGKVSYLDSCENTWNTDSEELKRYLGDSISIPRFMISPMYLCFYLNETKDKICVKKLNGWNKYTRLKEVDEIELR